MPIAFCILTLHQVMKGTDSEPPPIATSAETPPMPRPAALMPSAPGSSREGLGLMLSSIWIDT